MSFIGEESKEEEREEKKVIRRPRNVKICKFFVCSCGCSWFSRKRNGKVDEICPHCKNLCVVIHKEVPRVWQKFYCKNCICEWTSGIFKKGNNYCRNCELPAKILIHIDPRFFFITDEIAGIIKERETNPYSYSIGEMEGPKDNLLNIIDAQRQKLY